MKLEEIKNCIEQININDLSKLKDIIYSSTNILILGNGGSNSISSHIAQDYTKSLGKRAISFTDSSRLTCYINDYGMEQAYCKFIEHFFEIGTLVILISSSGNSLNIINAAEYCKNNDIKMITLSGFSINNRLRSFENDSLLHFWVDSHDYGVVECTHEIILHSVI